MLAAFARSSKIKESGESSLEVSKRQKKSNDQRAMVTRYYGIRESQSLHMKNYLVTGGHSPLVGPLIIFAVLTFLKEI